VRESRDEERKKTKTKHERRKMIGNHSIASPNLARSPSVNGEENDRKKKKQHEEKEKKHSKSLAFFLVRVRVWPGGPKSTFDDYFLFPFPSDSRLALDRYRSTMKN